MTMTKTLRSIVTEQKYPTLGTADDAVSMSRGMQWLANQAKIAKTTAELDLEGLQYNVEGTPTARDIGRFIFGTKAGGTLISHTDTGPVPTQQRNRCHLQFIGGDYLKVGHPLRITGPHDDSERNKSEASEWEQQCGIWAQSITEIEAVGQDIDHVWGDFLDIGFDAKDPRRTTKATIIPGRWDRCGRVGFNAGGTASHVEMSCDGSDTSYIKRCPGDQIHCEIQGAGGFEDWNIHDLLILGQSLRMHLTGMNTCRDIRIHNNVVHGGNLYIMIHPDEGDRIEGIVAIQDNFWDADPADLCDIYNSDLVVLTGNEGPVSGRKPMVRTDGTTAVMQFGGCPNVTTSPNKLTGVR